ncbi:MAG: hypothetical protein QNM02_17375 [Acidimicrobiia bacterium]|nr:hypothetical protein [Acidimicrobiia bacterium]
MPYTLAMFLLWGMLMALIGGVVGWMLCRVRTRSRRNGRPVGSGESDARPAGGADR